MRNFTANLNKFTNLVVLLGLLSFAVILSMTFIIPANATSVYFGFSNPNVGHASLSQGPNYPKEKELIMHAGTTTGEYPDINFGSWVDKWTRIAMVLEIKEFTDGRETGVMRPLADYRSSGQTRTVTFDYITMRVYPYLEQQHGLGGDQNDATGSGVIYPNDNAINNLRNQEIRYQFRLWDNNVTPHVINEATLTISRKHIGMIWSHGLNQAGTQAELNSGTYRSGGTTYPEVRGYAYSTHYNQANIEFRSTEQLNTQPVRYAEWVRRGTADVWDMGKDNYRFGTWHIYWNGVSGNNVCNTANGVNYIRCYTVRFIPNKAEIDNLKGNVNITIELAHMEGNVEYMKRTLNFVIKGRTHHRPVASLLINDGDKNGITEAPNAQARFTIYTSYGRVGRFKVYYTVAQTGDFLPVKTTVPQSKFVWFEHLQSAVNFLVYLDNDNIDEADETITVTLVAEANYPYTIDANPTFQSVTFDVRDDEIPIVSIGVHPDSNPSVVEGPDVFAKFNITADPAPYQDLQVAYIFTSGGSARIDSSQQLPTHITITANTAMVIFSVKTAYNRHDSVNNGNITVRLDTNTAQANAYKVATTDAFKMATVLLINNDLPVISIAVNSNSTPSVTEADNAKVDFDVSANFAITSDYDVRINLTETGNFVDDADERTATISANATSGTLSVPITSDDIYEPHGNLTATLLADSNNPEKYAVSGDDTKNSASARIIDDDDPVISISAHSDSSPFVTEEPNAKAKFLFEVDKLFTSPLTINIIVSESSINPTGTSDFISADSEALTTHTFPANKFQDTLSIPIVYDEEDEDDGKVTVTLESDTNTPATYNIPVAVSDQSAEVMIKANTLPIISIALKEAGQFLVQEAENLVLMFNVSSNIEISENNLVVNISTTESNNMLVPVAMRETTATINVGERSTIYQLPVDDDNIDEYNSAVTATIEADTNNPKKYVLTTVEANRSAAVSVEDNDTPEISIRVHEDSKPSVTEQPGGMAKFEVISNILSDPGVIFNIMVEHEGEDFIDPSFAKPTTAAISAPNLTAVIDIPLTYDNNQDPEENGKVKITLQADPNRAMGNPTSGLYYDLASSMDDQVAVVEVLANTKPEISIAVHSDSADGTSEGNNALVKFSVTADTTTTEELNVAVLVTEAETSNFLPAVDSRLTSVTINANATMGVLEVTLENDQIHEADGAVTATLQADSANPPSYVLTPTVASQSATADVADDDSPVISIAVHEDSLPKVLEVPDAIVKFLITSTTAPNEDTTIEFAVSETLGSYLTATNPENVVLEMGQTFAEIEIPITYTIADGGAGTVVAILEPHATDTDKYSITTETASQSAQATIENNSLPVISIVVDTESATGVQEADDAVVKFKIFANVGLMSTTLDVGYTISESHAFLDSTKPLTGTVSLMGAEPSNIVEVALENDLIDEENGTVTVMLNEDTSSPTTYTIGASTISRKADANVIDDEIPTISIAPHSDSLPHVTENPGAVAKFLISSSLAPHKDLVMSISMDDTGDFLPITGLPISANLAAGTMTGELIVPIKYDPNSDSDGTIRVSIDRVMNPVDYQASQNDARATVTVKNLAVPILSIAVHQDSLPHTTESSSSPILFEVTTSIQFTEETVFNFEITETADFLSSAEKLKSFDVFPDGQSSYTLPIRIDDDQIHELHGAVTVTLTAGTSDPPQYVVNANPEEGTATAEIKDDELPSIMIRPVADAVIEGNPVGFELYSNSIRTETFTVNLNMSGTTNFLQTASSPAEFTQDYNTGEDFRFEFETIDNDLPGGRGTIYVKLLPGEGYSLEGLATNLRTASVIIIDNDTAITPIVSIKADKPIVTAGTKVSFTISVVPATTESVMLDVNVVPENERIVLWRVPTKVAVTGGKGYLKFYSRRDSENGIISATVIDDNRFELFGSTTNVEIMQAASAPADSDRPLISVASVVANTLLSMNSEPETENSKQAQLNDQQLPEVSIFTITQSVEEGQTVQFQISSSTQLNSTISIQVAISSTGNAVPAHYNTAVTLTSTQSNAVLEVPTHDDNIAEESDSVIAEVIKSNSYLVSEPKLAIATVLDTHDQIQRRNQIEAANQQVVPALMNAIGRSTYTATNNHLDLAFSDNLQTSFNLGGENSLTDLITAGGHAINEDTLSLRSVLGESSFVFNLSPEKSGYNTGSVWGLGDQVDIFEENVSESHSIDGDVFVGHFGVDTKLSQDSLVGLQVSLSESELTYHELDQDDLNYSVNTNLVSSYYGWSSADSGLELRAIGGYGYGEFIINQADYTPLLLNIDFITTSVNGVANITSFGNQHQHGLNSLNLKAESSVMQFAIQDDTNFIPDFEFNSNLNRLISEYTYQKTFEQGSSLSSFTQIGGVWGQNNTYDGFGIEVNGGFDFAKLYGFELSGDGQYLIDQTGDNYKNLAMIGELSFDSNYDQQGLQLKVSPSYGTKSNLQYSGIDSWNLFNRDITQIVPTTKITSEVAWGFNYSEDTVKLTPYYGFAIDDLALSSQHLGTKLRLGTNSYFTIEGNQATRANSLPDYSMKFTGKVLW